MNWRLHWLEAEGDLGPWRDRIAAEIEAAHGAIGRVLPLSRLDVLVQRLAGATIPETGMAGHAGRKSLLVLTLDPDNANFGRRLDDGALRRQVAHEVHHCLRMAATGHGLTLGEALVSEGLAGRFVGHMPGSAAEPWERAVDDEAIRMHRLDDATLAGPDSDHAGWFFGADGPPDGSATPGLPHGRRLAGPRSGPGRRHGVDVPAAAVLAAARDEVLAEGR